MIKRLLDFVDRCDWASQRGEGKPAFTTAGGDPVDIQLIARSEEETDLRIRIGVFGNEARSRLVLEQIRQSL